MTASSKIPDRTRNKRNQNKRKGDKTCDNTVQWPAEVQVLREALREMNEEQEKIELDTPSDTPMSEIHTRKRAWHRRKTEYLDAIQDLLLGRNRKAKITNSENKKRLEKAHKAHTDLVLQLYVKEKKRSSTQQTEFRNNLIDFYGVKRERLDGEEEIWCVVSHSWGKSNQRVAAHIMPAKLRDVQMKHIFGDEANDELFSAKNGLMLEKQIEICFDNFQLAIVPCLTDESSWELRVLDKHLLKMYHMFTNTRFEELHGRKLAFLNENRPRKRYLYYHWLVCMSVAGQKKMNMARIEDEKAGHTQYRGTPRRYLREEMIAALMGCVGHKVHTEKHLQGEDSDDEEEEDSDEEEEEENGSEN